MILAALILLPLFAGALAWMAERAGRDWPRRIALAALAAEFVLILVPMLQPTQTASPGPWWITLEYPWIPRFGISFKLALDGLSALLVLLTATLGLAAIVSSWNEIRERSGFYYFNLLWTIAGVVGVFLALDLFLFFFLWEVMLIPMYFIIAIWGHEQKVHAAFKFFIFTQGGGLLMLLSIVGLVLVHGSATGTYTFDYMELLGTDLDPRVGFWLMLGFFLAFTVKLPMVPLHTWLPDAHTQAPTGGSVLLAGILLKTGAYGLLRFAVPLFPEASFSFAPIAMALGVVGILYGAVLAYAQHDLKRLVAYTSVSHMGFVLLGIYAWTPLALQGVIMEMIAHGFSTGALFMIAGAVQHRLHTRDLRKMGGLWSNAPRLGAIALFFAVASLGLPGLANFVAEFLVLLGAFQVDRTMAVIAALGLIGAAVYSLILVQRAFHGPREIEGPVRDLGPLDLAAFAAMIVILVWLGVMPQPVFDTFAPTLDTLAHLTGGFAPPPPP